MILDERQPEQAVADNDGRPVDAEAEAIRSEVVAEFNATDPGQPVDDENMATTLRYVRLRRRYEDEIERVKEQTAKIVSGLESRLRSLEFFRPVAEDTARRLIGGGKAKSVKLVWGTIGFRTSPPRVDICDEHSLDPLFVKIETVKKPDKTAINEHFKSTGEVPRGCELIDAHEKFYVK
jgi:phage host-nuclease inhibitor protein Gam